MLKRSSRLVGLFLGLAAAMTGATLLLSWVEPGYVPDERWLTLARSAVEQIRPRGLPPTEIEVVALPAPPNAESSSLNAVLDGPDAPPDCDFVVMPDGRLLSCTAPAGRDPDAAFNPRVRIRLPGARADREPPLRQWISLQALLNVLAEDGRAGGPAASGWSSCPAPRVFVQGEAMPTSILTSPSPPFNGVHVRMLAVSWQP